MGLKIEVLSESSTGLERSQGGRSAARCRARASQAIFRGSDGLACPIVSGYAPGKSRQPPRATFSHFFAWLPPIRPTDAAPHGLGSPGTHHNPVGSSPPWRPRPQHLHQFLNRPADVDAGIGNALHRAGMLLLRTLRVRGGDHGLGEPAGAGVAAEQHDGHQVLPGGVDRRAGAVRRC